MSTTDALETFPNRVRSAIMNRDRLSGVHVDVSEDRSARLRDIHIRYVPDALCLELKAIKYYLLTYRNQGIFYEAATNKILDDLVAACKPRRMTVVGDFSARGGITTKVTAEYAR